MAGVLVKGAEFVARFEATKQKWFDEPEWVFNQSQRLPDLEKLVDPIVDLLPGPLE